METHQVFTSLKTFKRFLQTEVPPGSKGPFYGRIIGKKLAISTKPDNPGWYPDSPPIRYVPLELPSPSLARQWWKDLLDGEIADYRILGDISDFTACFAKSAIWESLPDIHMPSRKHEFRVCDEQEFLEIVGEERFNQMFSECAAGGISFRRVILGPNLPRKQIRAGRSSALPTSSGKSGGSRSVKRLSR